MEQVLEEPRKRITARVSDSVRDTLEQAADFFNAHGQRIRHGATVADIFPEYIAHLEIFRFQSCAECFVFPGNTGHDEVKMSKNKIDEPGTIKSFLRISATIMVRCTNILFGKSDQFASVNAGNGTYQFVN